jgi:molybdopterin-guanine dinucleotide biosynthesis protein A
MSDTLPSSALPPPERVPIVVLAGGKASMEMEAATGVNNRALIEVGGKPMLLRVVEALRDSEHCGEITVVGKVPPSDFYTRLPDKGDFVSNAVSGAVAYGDAPFVLICTCDLPFLTGEAVTDFVTAALEKAAQSGASVIYPVVPVGRCYQRFPGLKRTALKLKEAHFTGGNMMLTRPQFIISQRQRIADAYRARKSPLRLANMLGWDMILRLLVSQTLMPHVLTLPLLEKRISQLIAGPARVFVSAYPEIATDLDKPSDYTAVVNIFRRLEAGGTLASLPDLAPGEDAKPAKPRKKVSRPATKRPTKSAAQKGKPVVRKRTP